MTLGSYLAKSAFENILYSFVIAVGVIVAVTRDVRIAASSSLALYCIIALVFTEMVVFGWQVL
jgi:hypothetical protein